MANKILVGVEDGLPSPEWVSKVEPFLQKALSVLEYDGQAISVMFCTNEFIEQLNSAYRNVDAPTDVLSFESGEKFTDEDGVEWVCSGDIAISVPMVAENAKYFGTDQNSELKRLLLHGALHLNGMDHGEEHIEAGKEPVCEMLKLQEKILEELKEEKIIDAQ